MKNNYFLRTDSIIDNTPLAAYRIRIGSGFSVDFNTYDFFHRDQARIHLAAKVVRSSIGVVVSDMRIATIIAPIARLPREDFASWECGGKLIETDNLRAQAV